MDNPPLYKLFFIGDSAATVDFGNVIDEEINKKVIALFNHLVEHRFEGMIEVFPAYSSVTVYYDYALLRKKIPNQKGIFEWVTAELHKLIRNGFASDEPSENIVRIPVCYADPFGIDLEYIAEQKNISTEEIVQSHLSKRYRVYMLGFLPGFAYMGQVNDDIAVPRKSQPQSIMAGSVGIAGKQTGIYPLNSPGGWQILGRTPLKMFDPEKEKSCLLKAGDYVEFFSITSDEFENYQGGSV